MKSLPKDFLIGTATAAHQVEGNNKNSDVWVMEHAKNSMFVEPSMQAVEHYFRFREDIDLMAEAGFKAYRFSIEWARAEPENGVFDEREILHYREVLEYCHKKGLIPIVTMHHFTSPIWLIKEGGWKSEKTIGYFERYCCYVIRKLGDLIPIICTINEANMGSILSRFYESILGNPDFTSDSHIQIGIDPAAVKFIHDSQQGLGEAFQMNPKDVAPFLGPRSDEEEKIVMRAHVAARKVIKTQYPHIKVGITSSFTDYQYEPGAEKHVNKLWEMEFEKYLPYYWDDDFIGVQNYTRKVICADGSEKPVAPENLTKFNTEYYPPSCANVIRSVYRRCGLPILVTENGISTDDDEQRVSFIHDSLSCVADCVADGIPVLGFIYWSFIDNYEWQNGYHQNFGLVGVNRNTMERQPRKSLYYLGEIAAQREL